MDIDVDGRSMGSSPMVTVRYWRVKNIVIDDQRCRKAEIKTSRCYHHLQHRVFSSSRRIFFSGMDFHAPLFYLLRVSEKCGESAMQ